MASSVRSSRADRKKRHTPRERVGRVPLLPPMPDARFWIGAAVLLVLCLACYGTTLKPGTDFVWDDVAITDNRIVKLPGGIADIWLRPSENSHEEHYWPLVYTTFWAEYHLYKAVVPSSGGLWAPGYRSVNVLLHGANCVLIWLLLRRLKVKGAWFGAALFAVHPVHAESVAWIIERKDVLSGLFYLLAFHFHLGFTETRDRRRQFLAVGLFVAGMLSKSIVVTLPVAILIILWWRNGRLTRADLTGVAPMLTAGFVIAAADTIRGRLYYPNPFEILLTERLLIAPRAFWWYLQKLVWPGEQMAIYPKFASPAVGGVALVAVIGLLAALWALRHRIGRGPLAVFLYYGVTLAPVLGIITFGFMQYSYVADRFQYLASMAPLALFAAAGTALAAKGGRALLVPAGVVGAVLIALLGWKTYRYAPFYAHHEALWSRNVALNPEAWEAHQQLGRLLADRGAAERNEELGRRGIAHLQRSIELNPRYYEAHYNLGAAWHIRREAAAAEAAFRRALELNPDYGLAHNGLGAVLAETGRYAEAIPHFEEALDINPYDAEAARNLELAREELQKSR